MKKITLAIIVPVLFVALFVACNNDDSDDDPGTKKSSDKQITSFFLTQADNPDVSGEVSVTIDQNTHKVTVTLPAFRSTTLKPTIALSPKATVSPLSGVAQDFAHAVTYTVKAEDGSTQAYTVTVTFQQSGDFVGSATHPNTSGKAEVNEAVTSLSLKNFQTDSGPQLNVYLSPVSGGNGVVNDHVDLGSLPGIRGNYTFTIPANTDLTKYKYVVIWCVKFNVGFGYALLK